MLSNNFLNLLQNINYKTQINTQKLTLQTKLVDNQISEKTLQLIQDFLINLAQGNFDTKLNVVEEDDDQLAGIQVGINMVMEELQATTISREYLNKIYNGINEILIVLNENGIIQEVNEIGASKLLYNKQEFTNNSIEKFIHVDSAELFRKSFEAIKINKENSEFGLDFLDKNFDLVHTSCSLSYLFDKHNNVGSILLVAKDISVLLNAQQQLGKKSDELNMFVYKASHDLKSPVASMLGLLNLAEKSNDLTELQHYCNLLHKSTKKMETIINELLIIGRITNSQLDIKKINIHELLKNLIEEFELREDFKKVKLSVTIEPDANYFQTEFDLIRTILFNLIDNAIKYSKSNIDNPFVKVNILTHKKGILISVEDNGLGIEESSQNDVFKMFHRATYASTGTGLGLYIVAISVQKLGGNYKLISKIDEGSTFEIYLPAN